MATDVRNFLAETLSEAQAARLWTANYNPVLPFTPQTFQIGAILPMILYLFRWGHRRGTGKFSETFGDTPKSEPRIVDVTRALAGDGLHFEGFDTEFGHLVLGDLLLAFNLENKRNSERHDATIQRAFAPHYFASWIDLPRNASHLRGVPELIVSILADQPIGTSLKEVPDAAWRVGTFPAEQDFVRAFAAGTVARGKEASSQTSDAFDGTTDVGIDQLLTIRMAERCAQAPAKARGRNNPHEIPNQRPIAKRAARHFREDFAAFFDAFADGAIPRAAFQQMLESALAVGLTAIVLETIAMMAHWTGTGRLPDEADLACAPAFVDCSGGASTKLRNESERSYALLRKQMVQLPATFMELRLLEDFALDEPDLDDARAAPRCPDATAWINLLGEIASGRHDLSRDAEKAFRKILRTLADAAEERAGAGEDLAHLSAEKLRGQPKGRSAVSYLAEVLAASYESTVGGKVYLALLSSLNVNAPNGLARSRRSSETNPRTRGRRTVDVTSIVLTDPVLEYLVHRHALAADPTGGLAFPHFVDILRTRYGFYVDQSPPQLRIANDLLTQNRHALERRLRDLGLLIGVNDAERMKKLRPRYKADPA